MARITVLGGSGYAGAAIVAEAITRGHEVTSVSRNAPTAPVDGATYVEGSVLDAAVLDRALDGADVVVSALSPRGDMAGEVEGVLADLVDRLAGQPTRLGFVGGASSLLVEEGGPRLWDVTAEHMPDEVKPEVQTGLDALAALQDSPESLDWFYVSPPQDFGSWLGTASKGTYTRGGDVLLKDADGASTISADDLALAILDEVESPAARRGRFTAIA
ncbi:NAD-dependent epimerase/dehydratase family protein [Nocardioides oleivorans]|uniref:NAD-dependent epimerase/dehydratase family protein n=1 Tax=Nocardioides oleivorans TaxID=273676 RepID=A0A4Q2RUS4_9ACTN|nr:NAD(P)H-binding protein [Nocardioides oleivorans]RYB92890.1 NAD-dependent epimerase/dehydratase family protein [Nocardioides oleivorans]